MATCNSWLWQVLNLHIAWICMDLWDKRRNTQRKLNESASVPTCISIQTVPPWICSISSHSHMSETRGEPQDVPGLNIRPMPILPSLSWFPCTWQLHLSMSWIISAPKVTPGDSIHFHPKTAPTWNPTMLFATILSTGAGGPIKLLTRSCAHVKPCHCHRHGSSQKLEKTTN